MISVVFNLIQKHKKQRVSAVLFYNSNLYSLEISIINISKSKIEHSSKKNWKNKRPESGGKIFQLYQKIIFDQMQHGSPP